MLIVEIAALCLLLTFAIVLYTIAKENNIVKAVFQTIYAFFIPVLRVILIAF